MSNNIVQLVDKDSNNIFPIAGSMAGDSVATQMIKDGAVTSNKIALTMSTVPITIAGRSLDAQKIDFGGGLVFIGGHFIMSGVTTVAGSTEIRVENLPVMSTIIACNIEALQIGASTSYASYQHFAANGILADFHLRNTTAGSNAIEVNFFILGILSS